MPCYLNLSTSVTPHSHAPPVYSTTLLLRLLRLLPAEHLSWKWDWAAEMVALSKELSFPFMAGSSLPTAWRMPPVDMPYNAEVTKKTTMLLVYAGSCCCSTHIDMYPHIA
jgi:hypothetical protein